MCVCVCVCVCVCMYVCVCERERETDRQTDSKLPKWQRKGEVTWHVPFLPLYTVVHGTMYRASWLVVVILSTFCFKLANELKKGTLNNVFCHPPLGVSLGPSLALPSFSLQA